ncbi:iron ABC transporter substrate-binding protein [Xaviernesmea oryzae]|uniref:Iron ABC transporter substrate-binding protein n=2 Tax=Xaviernesmea oryzae TaxID=464029 RepID=A0A1Q9AW97_9HYPH|nr:ABC transporter substrate-binding protein [Xaviernesmea oryzae]OLP59685.1 iron ABC transporter substrate-binding protein [Xaviernesmea oryzae]
MAHAEPLARLNVLCGVDEAWCAAMKDAVRSRLSIDATVKRRSTGEILDQVRSEKADPQTDVWWGGTGDAQLQAASEGLLQAYQPPSTAVMLPWADNFFDLSGGRSAGIYAGALGFAYNTELLKQKGLKAPACWKDLLDGTYADAIELADPNSSGTAYTALATLVQLFGEDEAFKFLSRLGANISSYPQSGSAPVKDAAHGDTLIGISFIHDAVTLRQAGYPLEIVAPCEGTGYEIGAVSIVKGAKNLDAARAFVSFALSAEGQATGAAAGQNQVPSNAGASLPPGAPDISMIRMVDYDFATFGSADERRRLLRRFDNEIRGIP